MPCPQTSLREGLARGASQSEGGGAPKGATFECGRSMISDASATQAAETPFDAPPWRFWAPGPCFRDKAPAGFRPPFPVRVQPLKAEPRSGPGRRPGASGVRRVTSTPRPQAPPPHPALPSVPGNAPQRDEVKGDYSHNRIYVKKQSTEVRNISAGRCPHEPSDMRGSCARPRMSLRSSGLRTEHPGFPATPTGVAEVRSGCALAPRNDKHDAYAGLNPASVSAALVSSDASDCKNACTAGRCFRELTTAKS